LSLLVSHVLFPFCHFFGYIKSHAIVTLLMHDIVTDSEDDEGEEILDVIDKAKSVPLLRVHLSPNS
jgi:hypothetical protein